jgi:hypothetical protein
LVGRSFIFALGHSGFSAMPFHCTLLWRSLTDRKKERKETEVAVYREKYKSTKYKFNKTVQTERKEKRER